MNSPTNSTSFWASQFAANSAPDEQTTPATWTDFPTALLKPKTMPTFSEQSEKDFPPWRHRGITPEQLTAFCSSDAEAANGSPFKA